MDAVEALLSRVSIGALAEPAPDDAALKTMFQAAHRAPDHGRLRPWRFVVVRGDAREKLGQVLVEALLKRDPQADEKAQAKERAKPSRAPVMIVVAAKTIETRGVPPVEQIVAVGAATQNIMLAAHALGYGAIWKTGTPAYDEQVKGALGLEPADDIIGFIYIGTPQDTANLPTDTVDKFVVEWTGVTGG